MLQENAITGLFFIIGIGFNSPPMLFGACISTLSGLFLAKQLKYGNTSVEKIKLNFFYILINEPMASINVSFLGAPFINSDLTLSAKI